ncbi:MAG: hypothetical protein R3324_03035, partial [Halobacteriales archaeon]|nr:hypothetical protein [Halobacteriales archaeon]
MNGSRPVPENVPKAIAGWGLRDMGRPADEAGGVNWVRILPPTVEVVFDLDGVLLDSERRLDWLERALSDTLRAFDLPEYLDDVAGYWRRTRALAEEGFTLADALAERFD